MFPVGYEFVQCFADGLVNSNGRRPVEMVAGRCFDELLGRSFFETSKFQQLPYSKVQSASFDA
jgi:hypothetical protein